MIFIVPTDGSLVQQPFQYLTVKEGSNIQLPLNFYLDTYLAELWNLQNATFTFRAKTRKNADRYVISKDQASLDWDESQASAGVLKLVLNTTDLADAGSLFCEFEFQPSGSTRVYKTKDFIIEIVKSVED